MFVQFSFSTMASVRQIRGGMSRMDYRLITLDSDNGAYDVLTVSQARRYAVNKGMSIVDVRKDGNVVIVTFGDREYHLEREREERLADNPDLYRATYPSYRRVIASSPKPQLTSCRLDLPYRLKHST